MIRILSFLFVILCSSFAYSKEKIELIVPYGAGGGFDLLARRISNAIDESVLKVDVINKTGGASNIALSYFIDQKKALLLTGNPIIENKKYASDGYPKNLTKVAKPIYFIGEGPQILFTSLSVNSIDEMILLSQTKDIVFGANSPGTGSYNIYDYLCNILKVFKNCNLVTYRSSSFAIPDLLAGRINAYGNTYGAYSAFVSSGKAKAILVLDKKRFYALPEIVSLKEKGFDYDLTTWFGLFHVGLIDQQVSLIKKSIDALMTDEEYKKYGYEKIEENPIIFFNSQIQQFSNKK